MGILAAEADTALLAQITEVQPISCSPVFIVPTPLH